SRAPGAANGEGVDLYAAAASPAGVWPGGSHTRHDAARWNHRSSGRQQTARSVETPRLASGSGKPGEVRRLACISRHWRRSGMKLLYITLLALPVFCQTQTPATDSSSEQTTPAVTQEPKTPKQADRSVLEVQPGENALKNKDR